LELLSWGSRDGLQTPVLGLLKRREQQLAKALVPSYYCLYSLFNKIRDKGKIVSAW
jgi:hypothetical protein